MTTPYLLDGELGISTYNSRNRDTGTPGRNLVSVVRDALLQRRRWEDDTLTPRVPIWYVPFQVRPSNARGPTLTVSSVTPGVTPCSVWES